MEMDEIVVVRVGLQVIAGSLQRYHMRVTQGRDRHVIGCPGCPLFIVAASSPLWWVVGRLPAHLSLHCRPTFQLEEATNLSGFSDRGAPDSPLHYMICDLFVISCDLFA